MSKDNIIEQLGDIENIFVSWYKYKTNKTYKNNQSEAERIIKKDLGTAADSFPLLEKLANEYGLIDSYPELHEASGDNALDFIGEVKHDLNKESINHYRGLLVQELMGKIDMATIDEFYALSKDINRWADNLKKDDDVLRDLENRQNKTSTETGQAKAEQDKENNKQQLRNANNEITDRQRYILQALHKNKAFDRGNLMTTAEVAKEAEGPANPENFKEPMSDLSYQGLIETKTGHGGGVWLTEEGIKLTEHIISKS